MSVHIELRFCAETCTVTTGTRIRANDQTFPESFKKTDYLLGLFKKRKKKLSEEEAK